MVSAGLGKGPPLLPPRRKRERRFRVLLVDDSDLSLGFMAAVLDECGHEVGIAREAPQIESLVQHFQPDVVLADVNMPGVSGPELCRLLKSRLRTREVPVILFSAFEDRVLERMARTCGADGYISKLDGVENVAARLASVLAKTEG